MIYECQRGLHFLDDHVEHGLVEDHLLDGVQLGQVQLPLLLSSLELELVVLFVILPLPLVLGLRCVQYPAATFIPYVAMVDNTGHGDYTFVGHVSPF